MTAPQSFSQQVEGAKVNALNDDFAGDRLEFVCDVPATQL
jgi:hypothetical protein